MFRTIALAASVAFCLSAPARAAIDITLLENAAGVQASFAGTLDLTGAEFLAFGLSGAGILPSETAINFDLPDQDTEISAYFLTTSEAFGSSDILFVNTSFSGDVLGITEIGEPFSPSGNIVLVPRSYGGEFLSGEMFFLGLTLAGMGILPGEYLYTLPNDAITLTVVDPIPLPAGGVLMATALAGAAFLRRRKGRASR